MVAGDNHAPGISAVTRQWMQAPSRVLLDFAYVFQLGQLPSASHESFRHIVTETDDPHGPMYGLTVQVSMPESLHPLGPASDGDDAGA